MKTAPFLLLILLMVSADLCAQQQEKKMMERWMNPDKTQQSVFQKKTFEGSAARDVKPFQANSFNQIKAFEGSSFVTRSFFGIKNPWFGNKVYQTGDSRLIKNAKLSEKAARENTETFTTDTYRSGEAAFDSRSSQFQGRPFLAQGGSQSSMSLIDERTKRELSIDEVRELLNKPR